MDKMCRIHPDFYDDEKLGQNLMVPCRRSQSLLSCFSYDSSQKLIVNKNKKRRFYFPDEINNDDVESY